MIYKQNCKNCGKYYEGQGKYFCSNHCARINVRRPDVVSRNKLPKKIGTINKLIRSLKGRHNSPKTEFQKGLIPWNKGKKHSDKSIKKMSRSRMGKCVGKNNPHYKNGLPRCLDCNEILKNYHNQRCRMCWSKWYCGSNSFCWQGGISFEPYSPEFNNQLKEQIRHRDNYTCQKCFKTQEEELQERNRRLAVHHIDYDKKNCEKDNLIALCLRCNNKVNSNRTHWQLYFTNLIDLLDWT